MTTTIIAEFFEYKDGNWNNKGTSTVILNNNDYHPYIDINQDNKDTIRLPISDFTKFEYNYLETETKYDLIIENGFNFSNKYGLRFDTNSSVSFDIFKNKLNLIINKKFTCIYYNDSKKLKMHGQYNEDQFNGNVTEYYNNRKNSIKFKGEMEDNEYCCGTFYNKESTIQVVINNIVNNEPNGYITININKENIYEGLYEDINGSETLDIESDNFVNELCKNHFGYDFMKQLNFKSKSSNERDYMLWKELKELKQEIINQNNKYTGLLGILRWIIGY